MTVKSSMFSLVVFITCFCLASITHSQTRDQTDQTVSMEDSEAKEPARIQMIEEIVSIGTKRKERSASDLSVPVDVLNQQDLETHASSDILDILSATAPSYNVAREPISDAATLVRPANLRGLPTDSTLILLNNKRRHKSAVVAEFVSGINKGAQGVDVFPLAGIALKQVEVLRDGASAQYGSDPIAGAINFQLADDPTIRKLRLQTGSTYEGDGDKLTLSGVFGAPIAQDGFVTFAFETGYSDPTSRGSQDPEAARLIAAGNTNVANPVVIWGAPKLDERVKLLFNSEIPLPVGALYSFGTWSTRNIDGSFFYRNPNRREGVFADDAGNPTALLVADLNLEDGRTCPTVPVINGIADTAALNVLRADPDCFVFNELFPGGFTPRFGGDVRDQSLTAGWRGTLERLTYDLSVGLGKNEVSFEIRNTVNASYGPETPTEFDAGRQTQSEVLLNADFTVPVNAGLASDITIAFGFQYHDEEYEIEAGQEESWKDGGFGTQGFSVGSNGFQGFSPEIAGAFTRDSYAGYLEAEADITSEWLLSAAFRYEDFSDFGDDTNFKVSSRYRFSENFSLRGAVSTGFRAPSVGQGNLRRSSTVLRDGRLVEVLGVSPTNPIAALKGGKGLQPETAVNLSLGMAFDLGPASITLDWYKINVDDRIARATFDLDDADRMQLAADGVEGAGNVSGVSFFINDFDSETTGIDLVASVPLSLGFGSSEFTLAYSLTDTSITSRGDALPESDVPVIENGLPQHRVTMSFLHTQGLWDLLVRLNYYSKIEELLFNDNTLSITGSAITIVDLELAFTPFRNNTNYRISIGAKNIFDTQPDMHRFAGMPRRFGADFPLAHPAGFNGGSYYLKLSADF